MIGRSVFYLTQTRENGVAAFPPVAFITPAISIASKVEIKRRVLPLVWREMFLLESLPGAEEAGGGLAVHASGVRGGARGRGLHLTEFGALPKALSLGLCRKL